MTEKLSDTLDRFVHNETHLTASEISITYIHNYKLSHA